MLIQPGGIPVPVQVSKNKSYTCTVRLLEVMCMHAPNGRPKDPPEKVRKSLPSQVDQCMPYLWCAALLSGRSLNCAYSATDHLNLFFWFYLLSGPSDALASIRPVHFLRWAGTIYSCEMQIRLSLGAVHDINTVSEAYVKGIVVFIEERLSLSKHFRLQSSQLTHKYFTTLCTSDVPTI